MTESTLLMVWQKEACGPHQTWFILARIWCLIIPEKSWKREEEGSQRNLWKLQQWSYDDDTNSATKTLQQFRQITWRKHLLLNFHLLHGSPKAILWITGTLRHCKRVLHLPKTATATSHHRVWFLLARRCNAVTFCGLLSTAALPTF